MVLSDTISYKLIINNIPLNLLETLKNAIIDLEFNRYHFNQILDKLTNPDFSQSTMEYYQKSFEISGINYSNIISELKRHINDLTMCILGPENHDKSCHDIFEIVLNLVKNS